MSAESGSDARRAVVTSVGVLGCGVLLPTTTVVIINDNEETLPTLVGHRLPERVLRGRAHRITHHAEIIPIEGESYRKREAELTRKKRRGSA